MNEQRKKQQFPYLSDHFGRSLDSVLFSTIDCHFHVFGPHKEFPLAVERLYTPDEVSLNDYRAAYGQFGVARSVIVNTSVYGPDNSLTLKALSERQEPTRAVLNVSPGQTLHSLQELTDHGVRGLRVNSLTSTGVRWPDILPIAQQIAPFGWHIEVLTDVSRDPDLYNAVNDLPVDVVFAHMGFISSPAKIASKGFSAMLKLLDDEKCWVKLSAAYRLKAQGSPLLASCPIIESTIDANPSRLVWGSDWPHPFFNGPTPSGNELIDLIGRCSPTATIAKDILIRNPERLYSFDLCVEHLKSTS